MGNNFFMEHPDFPIFRFDNILSTNSYLKQNIDKYAPFTTIWSDGQEKGRGRYNRSWISQKGKDLTFSILLPLNKSSIEYWKNITQVAAYAISEELKILNFNTQIKWPNDILINNKKVCGLLCEVVEQNKQSYAVLGIGLNVNSSKEELEIIDQPATSLYFESGKIVDRDILIIKVISSVISMSNELMNNGFFDFKSKILTRLAWNHEIRTIEDGKKQFDGKILDLNDDGTLKFQKNSGEVLNLISGEISFKKGS